MHPEVHEWLGVVRNDERPIAALTVGAIQHVLEGAGPDERRPLVERLKGSRVRALRELRPAVTGHTEVRLLFAFDPECRMVLLVAGEHTNRNWPKWYRDAVPLAEARYEDYLRTLTGDG